jgi:hypothetical protein
VAQSVKQALRFSAGVAITGGEGVLEEMHAFFELLKIFVTISGDLPGNVVKGMLPQGSAISSGAHSPLFLEVQDHFASPMSFAAAGGNITLLH